ncbi:MAG TPA: sigma-70 family RNA polymerase sigma factor [Planctomycetota bacterium]|nr:sigma-70 family RNA polymerase sigma factor [Planctomycetota bacterium]
MSITTCEQRLDVSHMDLRGKVPEQYWDLVEQHRDELIHQAYSILGRLEDAEDVVQETFCEAFRDTSKIHPDTILQSLRLINKTNALDRARSRSRARKRISARSKSLSDTKAFTTGGFSGIELRDWLNQAVKTLPENLRQVVELRYFEHLSYKEISERLNMPVGAVGPLLSKAIMRLYPQVSAHLKAR